MSYPVHVETLAVADAEGFRSSLEETSLQAAERFTQMIEKAIESLADFPNRYALAPEAQTHHREIRQMFVGNYRILYVVKADAVRVIRIRHSSQQNFKAGELN
jgi:plasmid stabilization system protein ParE